MTDKDKKNMVKARLLVLSEMFCEKTDDEHPMDTFEIIDYLRITVCLRIPRRFAAISLCSGSAVWTS